jgi:hypothetical protein
MDLGRADRDSQPGWLQLRGRGEEARHPRVNRTRVRNTLDTAFIRLAGSAHDRTGTSPPCKALHCVRVASRASPAS